MKWPNVNELDIDEMLTSSEIAAGVLRVVYNLQQVEDYTKENAAQDLINLLADMRYLTEPLEIKKGRI